LRERRVKEREKVRVLIEKENARKKLNKDSIKQNDYSL